jgi:hypothetical protein
MRPADSLDAKVYAAALFLYPPAFRREFSQEMTSDFHDARREARHGRGLWTFRLETISDLARSVVRQWLRTGLPLIALLAMAATWTTAALLANVWRPSFFELTSDTPDAELIALQIFVVLILLVIAATIIFTVGFTHLLRPRSRP